MARIVKTAIVQPMLSNELTEALNRSKKLLDSLTGEIDIVVFPESWLLLNPYSTIQKQVKHYDRIINFFKKIAKEINSYIIPGALYTVEDNKYYIVSPLISRDGEVIGIQYKINLFKKENEIFSTKNEIDVFFTDFGKIGLMICYDINFPEISRILIKEGAELLINPSRIRGRGVKMWHLYLMTRGLENRVPIVGVNVYYPDLYFGKSIAINLYLDEDQGIVIPEKLIELNTREEIKVVEIDLDLIKDERSKRIKEIIRRKLRAVV